MLSTKLIALDLDNTLLKSDKTISRRTVESLEQAAARGIYIVLNTGRNVLGVQPVLAALPCVQYVILSNGAVIKNLKNGQDIIKRLMPVDAALRVLDVVEPHDVMYDFFTEGVGYTEKRFFHYIERLPVGDETKELLKRSRKEIDNIRDYLEQTKISVEKINLQFLDLDLRKKIKGQLSLLEEITVTSSLNFNLEINDRQATKGAALSSLCQYLDIPLDQTMAFGDSANDYSMLKTSGMGIAMGNASEEIKEIADFITETNEEDGIAAVVEKL